MACSRATQEQLPRSNISAHAVVFFYLLSRYTSAKMTLRRKLNAEKNFTLAADLDL